MSDPTEWDRVSKLMDYYVQGIVSYAAYTLALAFGAFSLLQLIQSETGLEKPILFLAYIVIALLSGFPVQKVVNTVLKTRELMTRMGIRSIDEEISTRLDPLALQYTAWMEKPHFGYFAWLVLSMALLIIGIVVYL